MCASAKILTPQVIIFSKEFDFVQLDEAQVDDFSEEKIDLPVEEPENIVEDVPTDVTDDIPEDVPEIVSEDIPETIPDAIPEVTPEDDLEDLPDLNRAVVPVVSDKQHTHLVGDAPSLPSYQFSKELTSWCDRENILTRFEPGPLPAHNEIAPVKTETTMESSLPDLITEDGQIVPNETAIDIPDDEPGSEIIGQELVGQELAAQDVIGQEIVSTKMDMLSIEDTPEAKISAIETSGLKLPILDNPAHMQLIPQEVVKSNIISTEFAPLQPALESSAPLPICDSPRPSKSSESEIEIRPNFDDLNYRWIAEQSEIESLASEVPQRSLEVDIHRRSPSPIDRMSRVQQADLFLQGADDTDEPSVADSSSQTTDSFWVDPDELKVEIDQQHTETYGNQLLLMFQQQRNERIGLDLKLKSTIDQVHIWIHRILLQGLVGNQISSSSHFLELSLSSTGLTHLVKYLYTGDLELTLDSCEEYLEILSVLGPIPFIQNKVQMYLENCATQTSTCGRVMEITRKFGLSSMSVKLMEIVGAEPYKNLDIILSMDHDTMCDFISKERFSIHSLTTIVSNISVVKVV